MDTARQHTIGKAATLRGRGLFGGQAVEVTFGPAPANHGVVFVRKDLGGKQVPARIQNVVKRPRRTALKRDDAEIHTCEHVMSAVAGLRIDNLVIEMDAPELPAFDGSATPFVESLEAAGVSEIDAPRQSIIVREPVTVKLEDAMIAALPCDEPDMQVLYELDYGQGTPLGRQVRHFDFRNGDYLHEIAPARTYCLEAEARELRARGMATHLSEKDILVIGDSGPLGDNALRFPDEPVRHKMLDLIGDLYLIGAPIQGRIIAYKSGHPLNHMLARALLRQHEAHRRAQLAADSVAIDIRKLMRMLPHRFPMLLVDRVLEIDEDHRAVGVKNVTINEPFFQGHYPTTPIMPGVLVVEAMAQLSGVLIGQTLEHTGKLAVLLSLDRVKLRKPVTPGDQLVLEAETVRVRSRIAHMRCRAYVGQDVAAEAEVKFMLVDDEQE